MEQFEKIKALIATMEADVQAFYAKGNKSAGTRVRGACQDLKGLAQELRVDVQNLKNGVAEKA